MSSRRGRRALLVAGSCLAALLLAEAALRLAVDPAGRVLGRELPPVPVIPAGWRPDPDADRRPRAIPGGREVTRGDLEGLVREDSRLGWAPREGSRSANGWWQSDALGARRRGEVARARPAGERRVLLFGDSYAQGHGLPQEETLAALLDARPGLEVLNFGVSGYGVGQAYLRHEGLPADLEADAVLLLLVPTADLWRDVNVLRALAGWESYALAPRFARGADGALQVVASPYRDLAELLGDNALGLAPRLRDHLRAHDRLYDPWRHEARLLSGASLVSRLVQAGLASAPSLDGAALLEPGSEALDVTDELVALWRAAAEGSGRRLLVAVLPVVTDVEAYRTDPEFARRWDALVERLGARADTLDLMPSLLGGEPIDVAFDLGHYGPKVQRRLAAALEPALVSPR